ncbi:MAG: glycosyltransferase, partial [Pseudomonadota bacterium]|nr:glycosyltransferase [Pseudomonadota bacterium]
TFASRHALGILQAVGLPELVGEDASEYLDKAVSLATDWDRLASMRDGLRTRVAASPVCDHAGFAAHFTDLMRAIWRQFCANAVA